MGHLHAHHVQDQGAATLSAGEISVIQRDVCRPWAVVTRQLSPKDWDVCVYHGTRNELVERVLCQTRKLAFMWHTRLLRKCRKEREEKKR